MSKGQTLQDPFLNTLRKDRIPVSIFLVNGIKLQGQIESFDQYVVLLKNTVSQMVYKHAISTVVPARNPRAGSSSGSSAATGTPATGGFQGVGADMAATGFDQRPTGGFGNNPAGASGFANPRGGFSNPRGGFSQERGGFPERGGFTQDRGFGQERSGFQDKGFDDRGFNKADNTGGFDSE